MKYPYIVVLAAIVCACGPGVPLVPQPAPAAAPASLSTEFPTYGEQPEAIVLRLANAGGSPLGYNLCRSTLERLEGRGWTEVQSPEPRICTAELRTLAPGEQVTYAFGPLAKLQSGQYRVRTFVENLPAGTRSMIVSGTFAVTPKGPAPR